MTGISTTGAKGLQLRRSPFFKQVWQRSFVPSYKAATKNMQVDEVCLVGHNSRRYDDLLLISEMIYAGINMKDSLGVEKVTCRDSHLLAKQLQDRVGKQNLPRTKLGAMYSYFAHGKVLQNAHDALADCRATGFIIENMWNGDPKTFPHIHFCNQVKEVHKRRHKKRLTTEVRFPRVMKCIRSGICKFLRQPPPKAPIVQSKPSSFTQCSKCGTVSSRYFTPDSGCPGCSGLSKCNHSNAAHKPKAAPLAL